MHRIRHSMDSVHFFMAEQAARIVAASGRPCDRFHVGKHILQGLRDAPDFVAQIDGGTGETETNQSLMERSVRCAIALKNQGLKAGDVIVLMAPNHIHTAVPMYAALYLGVTIAAVDRFLTVEELCDTPSISESKIIFCQSERADDVGKALKRINGRAKIITFDKGSSQKNLQDFIEKSKDGTLVKEFMPSHIDTENTISFLIATSGTTGKPKAAPITHKNFTIGFSYMFTKFSNFPGPMRMALIVSHLQWITAIKNYVLSAMLRFTRLQSSLEMTPAHAVHLINTYKPTYMILSPTFLTRLIEPAFQGKCDLTCFKIIVAAGSAVSKELIERIKIISPNTDIFNGYGMSEAGGYVLDPDDIPIGTCGRPMGIFQYRLVDIDTQEDITEPHKPGELWVKGVVVFKGYWKNPSATKEVFSEDGWLKTGDLLCRDENWKFFYVERIKSLLKYKNHQISPVELEGVISRHSGVADVAVTGFPSPDDGSDWPVACVVRRPGCDVTADDVKDLVKKNLSDSKQLRGGVIFLDELPTLQTGKINRRKLKDLALEIIRE